MKHDLAVLIADRDADPYTGTTAKTRANWRVLGIGPKHVRVGRRVFYHPADIAAWIDARRVSSTSQKVFA